MQFHVPSVVHAVPAAIADPVPVVPVLAGVDAEEAFEAGALDATGLAEVADALAADVATVAKTPPETGFEEATPAADEALGAEVAADEAAVVAPDPELPVAVAPPQPVGGAVAAAAVDPPKDSTESPGLGNTTSDESLVPQPPAPKMLAWNMSGRALKAAVSRSMSWVTLRASRSSSSRLVDPAVMVMGAQFMYISRFPILLNQVQAKVASPVGSDEGISKE